MLVKCVHCYQDWINKQTQQNITFQAEKGKTRSGTLSNHLQRKLHRCVVYLIWRFASTLLFRCIGRRSSIPIRKNLFLSLSLGSVIYNVRTVDGVLEEVDVVVLKSAKKYKKKQQQHQQQKQQERSLKSFIQNSYDYIRIDSNRVYLSRSISYALWFSI